jgi:Putative Flp pilus-assembly TadE/G-like
VLKPRSRDATDRDEQGFVLIITTITLTVLLLFAGFAVDFGFWYVRSGEIKRAADAAALAGVVWMPQFDAAEQVARDTAARNGFKDGVDNIRVWVDEVADNNRQLRVTITDTKADQFFSSLVESKQVISRTSTAEYVLPVPLGSPKNTFGTGDLLSGGDAENFWAAVSGYCAGHESGDDKLAWNESYSTSSGASACNNGSAQSDSYDANGYLYAIDLPANASSLKLQVYDAPYYTSGSPSDNAVANGSQTVTTIFEVYDRNPTPLDLSNLTLLDTYTLTTDQSSATYQNKWVTFHTWNSPKAGQYYLRVRTLGGQLNSRASNGFGIRSYTGGSFSLCTTIPGASGYSSSCPGVHGVSDMSIYANGASATADFYLAQIDPVHAGKTMRVTLFDAGEGASTLRIIDPNGNPANFSWSTFCSPPTPPTGGCSGSGTSLDVSGTGTQPYAGLNSTSKYNDRYMILDIALPANYTALYGTKTWWKVRYSAGSAPTDRTTWSVNIVGDPVHLVK